MRPPAPTRGFSLMCVLAEGTSMPGVLETVAQLAPGKTNEKPGTSFNRTADRSLFRRNASLWVLAGVWKVRKRNMMQDDCVSGCLFSHGCGAHTFNPFWWVLLVTSDGACWEFVDEHELGMRSRIGTLAGLNSGSWPRSGAERYSFFDPKGIQRDPSHFAVVS